MLLVFGPRSTDYDFGPSHPLTPRRFGPGIDLLRAVGAVPGLAPEPASDEELLWLHTAAYLRAVKRFSADPFGFAEHGIGEGGDDPPFAGMHAAGAMVAGGSIRAMGSILRGDIEHAFHPGGGLHHAMADRASGFCIYDDPALAITRARRDGLRVMYIDLDVHHGDGVQVLHAADPGVLTFSIHESGRTLFPGTGGVEEVGEGEAAGTAVNVPLPAGTGEAAWLGALWQLLPELAATFGPDVIVSQHGADSHAWDPLAHLNVTTTAMGEAARLVDGLAHRHAAGRWLATGGGGYDVYRVVPRTWALTWLAGAHREVPDGLPADWRERWAGEAARFGQAPLPERFTDLPNAGAPIPAGAARVDAQVAAVAGLVRRVLVPRLVREATDRGWWDGGMGGGPPSPSRAAPSATTTIEPSAPLILSAVDAATWARLRLASRVISPFDPGAAHAIVLAAIRDGATVAAAVSGDRVIGVAIAGPPGPPGPSRGETALLALGVAPASRRVGLASRLLAALPSDIEHHAEITLAERDVVEPLDRRHRASIADRLLRRVGYEVQTVDSGVGAIDPLAMRAVRRVGRV